MTILIANPSVRPALAFDRIFLKSFVLLQDPCSEVIKVEMVVKFYALDPDTQSPVFDAAEQTVSIDDFNAWMLPVMAAQLGSPAAVATAYANAKTAANSLNIIDCMAAFQAGVARICAARGLFEVQVVE